MYTLKNFSDEFLQHGVRLYTHSAELSDIPVMSISVQEYPLDLYKAENELVLSTIIGCEKDDERLLKFIHSIRMGGAIALGISVLGDDFTPSDYILDYCEKNHFVLFFLPWELRFASITKNVLTNIKESSLLLYKNLQDSLLHSFMVQEGLDTAAQSLYYFLSAPVRIYDDIFILKEYFPENAALTAERSREDETYIFPLEISGSLFGYIAVLGKTDFIQKDGDIALLQKYISMPLFLWFNRERIENLTVNRLRNDFTWNLVNKSYDTYDKMLHEGIRLGHNLSHSFVSISIQIEEKDTDADRLSEYSEENRFLAESLERLLLQLKKKTGTDLFFGTRGFKCILFLDCSHNLKMEMITSYVEKIYREFREANASNTLRFGISEISPPGKPDFASLYADAELALQYCKEAGEQSYCFSSKDSQFYRLILELSQNPTIYKTAKEMMQKLENQDRKRDMDLKHTLITYIQCNYNQSLTARALFLNRHSLLYRIGKIEEITGLSLTDHRDLFTLEVYSRIMKNY